MDELVELWEKPKADDVVMIAGWQQWADAGSVSSGLPPYLIQHTGAAKIGRIKPHGYYLFQVPGTHAFLRPEVKLQEGHRRSMTSHTNEFHYWSKDNRGVVLFRGDEPHVNGEQYADAFFEAVRELGVRRIAVVGGVYGAVPYDKERGVSCVYSLPAMKEELSAYAVSFSDYEGGVSIGTYLADRAEAEGVELVVFYAFVPAYDFSQLSDKLQGMRVEHDYKAWYDLMRRLNHMFHLGFDLSELEARSVELLASMRAKIEELQRRAPQMGIQKFIEQLSTDFTEEPYMPLDVWERGLGDLFEDDGKQ